MSFRFEKLNIWTEANEYAHEVYKVTSKFPQKEIFSLVDQLRRAANSISTNIAEGSGSTSDKDFCHYLNIAIKSTYETVSLLLRAKQENFLNDKMRNLLYDKAEVLIKRIQLFKKSIIHKL
jgi:four helix bundle protein